MNGVTVQPMVNADGTLSLPLGLSANMTVTVEGITGMTDVATDRVWSSGHTL
jgi:hypothetical protein